MPSSRNFSRRLKNIISKLHTVFVVEQDYSNSFIRNRQLVMEPEDRGAQQDNRVLNYIKRRDCCVLVTFIVYLFGPAFYNTIESLNDVGKDTKRVDFGRMFSGTEGVVYGLKKEIYEVQDSIAELKRRDFGWRDVWDDMRR